MMNLSVEYKNASGAVSNQTYNLTILALIKHLAIAGQGYAPKPQKLLRSIGMFLHYSYYLEINAFRNNHFSLPPAVLYDPTDISQFSNIVGKALADFLSKRIDKSLFTVNYEAAMKSKGMRIKGERPDLIAFNRNSIFAIEAKGYSKGYGNMVKHKKQSQKGGIPVNFSIACVSTDLYKGVNCKYHDPINDEIPFDSILFDELTKKYYKGLSEFINPKYFNYNEVQIMGETFFEIDLFYPSQSKSFSRDTFFNRHIYFELLHFYRPKLILPGRIKEYAEFGISNEVQSFNFENSSQNTNIYIDNDRVGLQFVN
jgi:hypothetical protein